MSASPVIFAKAAEHINESILYALLAVSDLANSFLSSLLISFLNLCISTTLIRGSVPQHLMGMKFYSLGSPPATALASSFALSFPTTTSCPGTHLIVIFFLI